jgi:hypothetical protein
LVLFFQLEVPQPSILSFKGIARSRSAPGYRIASRFKRTIEVEPALQFTDGQRFAVATVELRSDEFLRRFRRVPAE